MPERTQKVLVVDDQSELRIVFEWALKKGHYDVTTAASARHALRLIEREHFDLILTDLAMPDVSGIELIEQVRANPERARTRIVAITAHGWDQIALQARAAGCDGVIQKPIDAKALRQEVDKYLSNWRFADGTFDDGSPPRI
jgi:CheY-like chemotaxis protein